MQQLVTGLVPDVGDVGRAGLGHTQAEHAQQADQGVVVGTGAAGRSEQGSELQRVQHGALLPSQATFGRVTASAGVGRNHAVDHRELVEGGDGAKAARDGGGGVTAALQVPQVHLELAAGEP